MSMLVLLLWLLGPRQKMCAMTMQPWQRRRHSARATGQLAVLQRGNEKCGDFHATIEKHTKEEGEEELGMCMPGSFDC